MHKIIASNTGVLKCSETSVALKDLNRQVPYTFQTLQPNIPLNAPLNSSNHITPSHLFLLLRTKKKVVLLKRSEKIFRKTPVTTAKVLSEASKASKAKIFAKIVKGLNSLTTFLKSSIWDVWPCTEHAFEIPWLVKFVISNALREMQYKHYKHISNVLLYYLNWKVDIYSRRQSFNMQSINDSSDLYMYFFIYCKIILKFNKAAWSQCFSAR